ncbi:MAG: hypothetical protein WC504_15900, partial [Methylobacter sp.]
MLNDAAKLIMFDDLIEQNENMNQAYDEQNKIIADMSKAIWQAKQSLDLANSALLAFIDRP